MVGRVLTDAATEFVSVFECVLGHVWVVVVVDRHTVSTMAGIVPPCREKKMFDDSIQPLTVLADTFGTDANVMFVRGCPIGAVVVVVVAAIAEAGPLA